MLINAVILKLIFGWCIFKTLAKHRHQTLSWIFSIQLQLCLIAENSSVFPEVPTEDVQTSEDQITNRVQHFAPIFNKGNRNPSQQRQMWQFQRDQSAAPPQDVLRFERGTQQCCFPTVLLCDDMVLHSFISPHINITGETHAQGDVISIYWGKQMSRQVDNESQGKFCVCVLLQYSKSFLEAQHFSTICKSNVKRQTIRAD